MHLHFILFAILALCGVHASDDCKFQPPMGLHAAIDMAQVVKVPFIRTLAIQFCSHGNATIQIWTPSSNSSIFTLVWSKHLTAPENVPTTETISLDLSEQRILDPNIEHYIGFYANDINPLPVPVYFSINTGNTRLSFDKDQEFVDGQSYGFEEPRYPYKFRVGLCSGDVCALPPIPTDNIPTLATTLDPLQSTMSTAGLVYGPPGPPGLMGPQGLPGIIGINGPIGEVGIPGVAAVVAASTGECDCTGIQDSMTTLGLIIWALILTIVLFFIVIGFVKVISDEKRLAQEDTVPTSYVYSQ